MENLGTRIYDLPGGGSKYLYPNTYRTQDFRLGSKSEPRAFGYNMDLFPNTFGRKGSHAYQGYDELLPASLSDLNPGNKDLKVLLRNKANESQGKSSLYSKKFLDAARERVGNDPAFVKRKAAQSAQSAQAAQANRFSQKALQSAQAAQANRFSQKALQSAKKYGPYAAGAAALAGAGYGGYKLYQHKKEKSASEIVYETMEKIASAE